MTRFALARVAVGSVLALAIMAAPRAATAQNKATVLQPAALQKLIPPRVFYRGQTTTTELRNSGGVEFGDGYYFLASLVDTSGYSNAVASKFDAYFITEVPLRVNGAELGAGAYGIGFLPGNQFALTDIGGHTVLTTESATDNNLERPRPLEVVEQKDGKFRLYEGRRYVLLSR